MEFNATFIVAFVSFIVFVFIMNIILYKPINDIVKKRKNYIDANYNEAKNNSEKTKSILEDRKNKLSKARFEAKQNVDEKVNLAKGEKDKITSDAKNQAKEKIEQERLNNINASNEAKNALKGEVKNLAQIICDKFFVTQEKITDIDNDLVEKLMRE